MQLLHSLDEDDSTVHTNMNSPRISKPASPLLALPQPPSSNQLPSSDHDDGGARVNLSNSSNHIATYSNSQKAFDGQDGEVDQPLLNRSANL